SECWLVDKHPRDPLAVNNNLQRTNTTVKINEHQYQPVDRDDHHANILNLALKKIVNENLLGTQPTPTPIHQIQTEALGETGLNRGKTITISHAAVDCEERQTFANKLATDPHPVNKTRLKHFHPRQRYPN